MKILKIELQNINSLKSGAPIVIDFESEQFKDVGLYAITGSTGAGKTTILDAITIALYHSIPRFNDSKGTLVDVVSYGANDAFSRVTFENENVVYEAFWGMRLASKTGKKLSNPQEEVCLKNLSTDVILASQKRALIDEIFSVTHLDYTQFLRSVMLAQGEFASFLTAKGPEKGRLLEQITGEQIYKKIGQGILDRKSTEENKLRELQSKINADDILTEEHKIELAKEDKELDVQIVSAEKETEEIQLMVNWHLKHQELKAQSESLENETINVNTDIENHKTEFEFLALNEKAEPFKELIQSFNRNESSTREKQEQSKLLETQLGEIDPEIKRLTELSTVQAAALENSEKEFNAWLPKFDLITALDGQLKNETENKQKAVQQLADLAQQVDTANEEKARLAEVLLSTEAKILIDEAYIKQFSYLPEVDAEISSWTTSLTTLKANKEALNESLAFITQKNKEVENSTEELKANKVLLQRKLAEIGSIDQELAVLTKQLSSNGLNNLLAEEKQLSLTESNWKQFKAYAEKIAKEEKELSDLSIQKEAFSIELASAKDSLKKLTAQIKRQEIAVADAEKILDLEKSISKYEDDRKNLISGQACGLCGSTTHPFTQNLQSLGVSQSEIELKTRRDQLRTLTDSKAELEKKEVKLNTSLESLLKQLETIGDDLITLKSKVKLLEFDCDLSDFAQINAQLSSVAEKLRLLDEKIKFSQQVQFKKDELLESLKAQNQAIDALKNKDATLSEKIKNANAEISSKQKVIEGLNTVCEDLAVNLTNSLARFNFKLPSVEKTNSFIERIENEIVKYNKTERNLEALKAETKITQTKIGNIEKQLEGHAKTETELNEALKRCDASYIKLKAERSTILPIDISVENKRNSLQLAKNQLLEKVELSKKELQKLLDTKTEKLALKDKIAKELAILIKELVTLQTSLNAQIKDSGFATKQDIENALLSKEDQSRYTQLKEQIKEKQVRLLALKEKNLKEIADLAQSKNFETSEAESKLALEELKLKKDTLLAEKGKIIEAFRKDQEIRDRNKEVYKKIDAQEAVCNVWKELFKIIGNSKDAFNVYVQRLTLKHLLDLANVHLYSLKKRYSLKMEEDYKPKEELNFNLIDHYQTDQARLVDTSSGGEKFIISLALALGLSDLASKNVKIDSLFIDEGFGTLDKNTLETVISTLETLQSQGKMIGIISHVENLKERIPTQIQITKKSNGVSTVEII